MTEKFATQTIISLPAEKVYKTVDVVMPDGKTKKRLVQLVRDELGNEDWEFTDERIRQFDAAAREMDERFKNTVTKPDDWKQPTTKTLDRKGPLIRETNETIKSGGITRCDMRKILVMNLGDPNLIIQQKGLDTNRINIFKKQGAFFTTLCYMAKEHGGEWGKAAEYLKPDYPII